MANHPLDSRIITSSLFFPRPATPGSSLLPNTHDGYIPIEDKIVLGYRFYVHSAESPIILFFHGNGEVASDYEDIAPLYHKVGASLLIVDYRGYGWSTGEPKTSALLTDATAALEGLTGIFKTVGIDDVPLFIKGRSLGSAPAIHLAHTAPERFKGLIVESGFADMPSVLKAVGFVLSKLRGFDMPVANAHKLESIHLPLLLIHGENDTLLPVDNAEKMYNASASEHKSLVVIPRAGHNNLMALGTQQYFSALGKFITQYR